MTDTSPRRVRTPWFRMSFPSLLKPRKNDEGKESYGITMLFPPGFDKKPFVAAMRAAMVEKFGADPKQWPKLKRKPDDVIVDFEEYNANSNKPLKGDWAGWTMVRASASTKYAPNVVGPTKGADGVFPRITDEREVYGGRWARATLDAYYYDVSGKGVTFGLANVQLGKHDKKFGGAVSAPEQDFDNAEGEMAGEGDAFDSGQQTSGDEDGGW